MSVNYRKRTIHMPQTRAAQIALAAAELGISSEQFIQSAITAALLTCADHDDKLAFALARAAGATWGISPSLPASGSQSARNARSRNALEWP